MNGNGSYAMVGSQWRYVGPEKIKTGTKTSFVGDPGYDIKAGELVRRVNMTTFNEDGSAKTEKHVIRESMPFEDAQREFGDSLRVYSPDVRVTAKRPDGRRVTVFPDVSPETGRATIESLKKALAQTYA
jgi:hypothetical protein